MLLFNAGHEDVEFTLPAAALRRASGRASCARTARAGADRSARASAGRRWSRARSLVLLRRGRMTELRATYRLQLGGGFGFAQARELVPYLRDLGVSHLYLPPSFQARAGSTHGYDVVDPTSISEELGGEASSRRSRARCARPGWA